MSDEEAELIHTLARQILDPANRELSLDELQAVAGSVTERDWEMEGCAATVESDSDCWFADGGCAKLNIHYSHQPSAKCPSCGAYGFIYDNRDVLIDYGYYGTLYREHYHCYYCKEKSDIERRTYV